MVLFAILFGAVAAAKTYAVRTEWRYAKWIPSGVAFAIGFLNTPSFSLARLIGGVVVVRIVVVHASPRRLRRMRMACSA